MKQHFYHKAICISAIALLTTASYAKESQQDLPQKITINGIAQNPEGIEYDKNDGTFLLSSLNALPIIKVKRDGTYQPFSTKEPYPLSTAGLQVDNRHGRLLAASFNGAELMDNNDSTKGTAHLRVYNLTTGALEQDIELSSLVPEAQAYFANDVAVDSEGNAYVSDWYAKVIYKVDPSGKATLFWKNDTGIPSGINGLDVHPDGYLLASLIRVNDKGFYADFGLVKIPLDNPKAAKLVKIANDGYAGFDGMVINRHGNIVGITNDQKNPGGNLLIELSSKDGWKSAEVIHTKPVTPATTVAITPDNQNYVIHQDFSDNFAKKWTIERIAF